MTDERESADAASDGTDDLGGSAGAENSNRSGQTAVVTPARPTGKRSRQRVLAAGDDDADVSADADEAEADDAKGAKAKKSKTTKAKAKSGGGILAPFKFVWHYMGQVVAELRKVIWPNRKQMISYTSVVLAFLAFMVTLIGFVDLGLAKLVLLVFG